MSTSPAGQETLEEVREKLLNDPQGRQVCARLRLFGVGPEVPMAVAQEDNNGGLDNEDIVDVEDEDEIIDVGSVDDLPGASRLGNSVAQEGQKDEVEVLYDSSTHCMACHVDEVVVAKRGHRCPHVAVAKLGKSLATTLVAARPTRKAARERAAERMADQQDDPALPKTRKAPTCHKCPWDKKKRTL